MPRTTKGRKRPCRICRRWFAPNPKLRDRQMTCGDPACKREWHKKACRQKSCFIGKANKISLPGSTPSRPQGLSPAGKAELYPGAHIYVAGFSLDHTKMPDNQFISLLISDISDFAPITESYRHVRATRNIRQAIRCVALPNPAPHNAKAPMQLTLQLHVGEMWDLGLHI